LYAKDNKKDHYVYPLEDKLIYIVGPMKWQNELMASFLEQEIGAQCLVVESFDEISITEDNNNEQEKMILLDCLGKNLEECLFELKSRSGKKMSRNLLCLFNVHPNLGIEENTIALGARGVFYKDDTLEYLPKALHAIFCGEMWLSRRIMTQYILNIDKQGTYQKKYISILTAREVEILTKIVEGATNEEIASDLCISKHTVKAHLYNTFKKINVHSRIEAALWAEQNL
jgi:DNA-binding NarL/FixJ family response regulator